MEYITRRDFLKVAAIGLGSLAFRPGFSSESEIKTELTDVLSAKTQFALAEKARSFLCPTPESAIKMADYLRNSTLSSADNICGPLAMIQLNGIVNHGVRPEDYWQAQPPNKWEANPFPTKVYGMFDEAFSPDRFDEFAVTTPLGDYDYNSGKSIQPGDFFFFRARVGHDNQAHMMTISRRGADGILYAITNYPDANKKWIIREVPFWDPKNPQASWVKELSRGDNSVRFASGDAGFYQYRLKRFQPSSFELFDQSTKAETLRQRVDMLARQAEGEWHVMVKNMTNGSVIAESGSRIEGHVASVFKVPLAMVYMTFLESISTDEADFQNILKNQGFEGNTHYNWLHEMLVNSDEGATGKIADLLIEKKVDRQGIISKYGAESTDLGRRHSSVEDISRFFARIKGFKTFRFSSTHQCMLDLLSEHTEGDNTRLGSLRDPKYGLKINKIYDKRGSIADPKLVIVADAGIVEVADASGKVTPYFIYLAGSPRRGQEAGYVFLEKEELEKQFIPAIADYLNSQ